MRKFKDCTGREWSLALSIGAVARVRDLSGGRFDLLEPSREVDGKLLFEVLTEDLIACWQVVAHAIDPQLSAAGVSAAEFGESMTADCLLDAQDKLLQEWSDFFRQLQRQDVATALEMVRAGKAKVRATVAQGIAASNLDETQAKMEAEIERICGKSFGSLRDSLESILPP